MTPVSMNTIYYFLQMESKVKGAEFLWATFGIWSLSWVVEQSTIWESCSSSQCLTWEVYFPGGFEHRWWTDRVFAVLVHHLEIGPLTSQKDWDQGAVEIRDWSEPPSLLQLCFSHMGAETSLGLYFNRFNLPWRAGMRWIRKIFTCTPWEAAQWGHIFYFPHGENGGHEKRITELWTRTWGARIKILFTFLFVLSHWIVSKCGVLNNPCVGFKSVSTARGGTLFNIFQQFGRRWPWSHYLMFSFWE